MSLHEFPDVEQRSDEWYEQRRGMITASMIGGLLTVAPPGATSYDCPECAAPTSEPCISLRGGTPIKTMHSGRVSVAAANASTAAPVIGVADNDTARGLTATLVAERITGWTEPSFMNDDMMRGVLHEPIARDKYADHNGVTVEQVGFLIRDDWGYQIGASPDGLVGDDGGLEIKCPRAKTHIRTVIADEVPPQHMAQVQTCLLVSGRKWWEFVSFHAGLPLWTKRVYPDPRWQTAIVEAAAVFETAAEQLISNYQARAQGLPQTERIADDLEVVI